MKERIQILYENNVISKEIADFVYEIIDFLQAKNYPQEKVETFVTHLAMASQRVLNNEECMTFDDSIWNQVENNKSFQKSLEIYKYICDISPVKYPLSEEKFILLHLCNLESRGE